MRSFYRTRTRLLTDDIPDALYWPCEPDEVPTILERITAGDRQHVHLQRPLRRLWRQGTLESIDQQ